MGKRKIITIGRQFGSGGHEIGIKLAARLNINCYDNELLLKNLMRNQQIVFYIHWLWIPM